MALGLLRGLMLFTATSCGIFVVLELCTWRTPVTSSWRLKPFFLDKLGHLLGHGEDTTGEFRYENTRGNYSVGVQDHSDEFWEYPASTRDEGGKSRASRGFVVSGNDAALQKSSDYYAETNSVEHNVLDAATEVDYLAGILAKKLENNNTKLIKFKPTCHDARTRANSCVEGKCLQLALPDDLRTRVSQLISPTGLRLTSDQHQILKGMSAEVKGAYDVIFVTAASSNHYLESQALLKNLHENVFPHMTKNFTLVFYNLGLTDRERALVVKYCKCQVFDFPFEKFPSFMRELKCYAWKPVMIKSQVPNANVVVWVDASVRFHKDSTVVQNLITRSRERGVQIGGSGSNSPFRTLASMYHYFGDEPCAYLNLGQAKATVGAYHSEHFVQRAVLEPWVACAFNSSCICPTRRFKSGCHMTRQMEARVDSSATAGAPIEYDLCHRFDQSAISIILHKLYQDKYGLVMVSTKTFSEILRGNRTFYFPKQ
ncbi:unnamed protein product [Lymnaea stagnalis]|uniref:Uncharacterized protein n=1 Tax=Lymnaea stagnalis TaxID=6523 RepID=A0AAV2H653_LYMST